MNRTTIMTTILAAVGVVSVHATDLATIIRKVAENCEKIESFSAEASVRYKI